MRAKSAANTAKQLLHNAAHRLQTRDPVPDIERVLDASMPLPVGDAGYNGQRPMLEPSFSEGAGQDLSFWMTTGGPGSTPQDRHESALQTTGSLVQRYLGPEAMRWFESRIEPAVTQRSLRWGAQFGVGFDNRGLRESAVILEWGPSLMDALPAPLYSAAQAALESLPHLRPALSTIRCGRRGGMQQLTFDIDFPLALGDLEPLMQRLGMLKEHPSLLSATALVLGARFTLPPGTSTLTMQPIRSGIELRLDVYLDLLPDVPPQIGSLIKMGMLERPRSVRSLERWLYALTPDGYDRPGRFSVLSVRVRAGRSARLALHLRPANLEPNQAVVTASDAWSPGGVGPIATRPSPPASAMGAGGWSSSRGV